MTASAARFAAVLVSANLLISCGTQRAALTDEFLHAPPEDLVARVRQKEARVVSLSGKGSMVFESPELTGSAFFSLSLKKPDSLLLSFEGPFGIGSGFLFLSREKFVMYNGIDNRVTTGDPNAPSLRSVIPFDLSLNQIIEAFSGSFLIPDSTPVRFSADEGNLLLEYRRGTQIHAYWVDPENDVVVRYEIREDGDRTLLKATASRLLEQDGLCIPRRITVVFPDQERKISIYYTSLDPNATDLSFAFSIPRNARTFRR
jgi:outer membrane lipoprotein-sorting protein